MMMMMALDSDEDEEAVTAGLGIRSFPDPALTCDARVLRNVLVEERNRRRLVTDYFKAGIQTALRPHMRKIVCDWMMEVTAEQGCHHEVFALAVDYMDRVLSRVRIEKSQFQLLASVCIFLASKFKELQPITAEKLAVYTDCSVSIRLIMEWELLVLKVLNWDLASVTAHTILNQLLTHSLLQPQIEGIRLQGIVASKVRHHTLVLITMCLTESAFLGIAQRLLATSCLVTAIFALRFKADGGEDSLLLALLRGLSELTGISPEEVLVFAGRVERTASAAASLATTRRNGFSWFPPDSRRLFGCFQRVLPSLEDPLVIRALSRTPRAAATSEGLLTSQILHDVNVCVQPSRGGVSIGANDNSHNSSNSYQPSNSNSTINNNNNNSNSNSNNTCSVQRGSTTPTEIMMEVSSTAFVC